MVKTFIINSKAVMVKSIAIAISRYGGKPDIQICIAIKALNRIFFLSLDNIDNKVKNLVKIDLSDKIR